MKLADAVTGLNECRVDSPGPRESIWPTKYGGIASTSVFLRLSNKNWTSSLFPPVLLVFPVFLEVAEVELRWVLRCSNINLSAI